MAVQLFGYILSFAGLCGLLIGTFTNEWKIIGHDNDQTVILEDYEGLWMKCTVDSSSHIRCTSFNSLLHQAFEIRVSRIIMITSIIFSSLAVLISISGLQCTKFLDDNEQAKARTAFFGGILTVCSGLIALGLTSWFMFIIVDEFFQNSTEKKKYVIGRSLICAFAASLLCFLGGVFLCTGSIKHLRPNKPLSRPPVSKNPEKGYV